MEQYENSSHGFMTTHRHGPTGSGEHGLRTRYLPGAKRVLMPVSYTITHIVSMLNLCCEKYRKSNPMEKADHIGRAPLLCTLTVMLFVLEDGGI